MIAVLLVLDSIAVALALAAAYWLRIASGLLPDRAFEEFAVYLRISLLIVPIWLVIFAFNNLYDVRYVLGGIDEYTQIAKACLFGIVAVIMLSYWVRIATLSRGWLGFAWVFGFLFVGGGRFLFRRAIYYLRRRGHLRTRALIVGANEQGKAIARQFRAADTAGVDIVGFIDDFLPPGAPVPLDDGVAARGADGEMPRGEGALRVLAGPDRLYEVARDYAVTEVVVVTNAVAWETFQEILQQATLNSAHGDFEIKLSPGFYEILTTGVRVTNEAFVPLLMINRHRVTGVDALLKAGLDYALALLALVVALPLLGLIALALRLSSRGPVLDRHEVLACGGRSVGGTFATWKFHTGLGDTPRPLFAHPLSQALALAQAQATIWSTAGGASGSTPGSRRSVRSPASPPQTAPTAEIAARSEPPRSAGSGGSLRVGGSSSSAASSSLSRVLYDTGLDKLPQLLNILRGDMSWVGPRTVSVGHVEVHSPWLPNLLTVKPGITGPWAVGRERTLDEEMRLTMVYIRNWTIWLDLQILLQTALRVLRLERSRAKLPER